jgi:hypothetical protein
MMQPSSGRLLPPAFSASQLGLYAWEYFKTFCTYSWVSGKGGMLLYFSTIDGPGIVCGQGEVKLAVEPVQHQLKIAGTPHDVFPGVEGIGDVQGLQVLGMIWHSPRAPFFETALGLKHDSTWIKALSSENAMP